MATTAIEIKTGFFPLAFFLFFCTPTIEIDGVAERRRWGSSRFEVAPGAHRVRVYFRYLFMARCGANEIDVTVGEGQVAKIKYWMPPWMTARGSLKCDSLLAEAKALPH